MVKMDGRIDGRTDGRTDGRMDGRMDGKKYGTKIWYKNMVTKMKFFSIIIFLFFPFLEER